MALALAEDKGVRLRVCQLLQAILNSQVLLCASPCAPSNTPPRKPNKHAPGCPILCPAAVRFW